MNISAGVSSCSSRPAKTASKGSSNFSATRGGSRQATPFLKRVSLLNVKPTEAGRFAGQQLQGRLTPLCRPSLLVKASAASANGGQPAGNHDSSSPRSDSQSAAQTPSSSKDGSHMDKSWATLMLTLPLKLAATAAKTDMHWLKKRARKHWWSRQHWPKVPSDTLQDVELPQPPVALWQKLLPLGLIFFCASFNLTILQNLKDAIMVTAAGAETLPFLASFCVLPASLAFFMIYGRLVERLPPRTVFYACVAPLVVFYAFFAGVLYPAAAFLHPHGMYERLAPAVPLGLHGFLKVVENWTYSLFFCMAELWGSVVISLLFWTLANEVCTVEDAKTIYPLMGISANVALVVAGNYSKWVNNQVALGSMALSLRYLIGTMAVLTGCMMAAKAFIDAEISPPAEQERTAKKPKKRGTLGDSFAVLRGSPKIRNLALLVMSYGVSHRLFEFAWKGQLRVLYPSAQAYQGVLADVSIATGYVTIALMLTGRFVFQCLGWGVAAAATPTVMLLSGAAFFGLSLAANLGISVGTLNLASAGVMAGVVTQVFARSSKFSLFDPAKEMVYIEMSKEEKSKGKAAVDLVGSQIGKSGASWIAQGLLLALGSITASLPIISAVFVSVIVMWLRAVGNLKVQIEEHERQQQEEKQKAAAAAAEAESALAAQLASSNGAGLEGRVGPPEERAPARWPGSISGVLGDDDGDDESPPENDHGGQGAVPGGRGHVPGGDGGSPNGHAGMRHANGNGTAANGVARLGREGLAGGARAGGAHADSSLRQRSIGPQPA